MRTVLALAVTVVAGLIQPAAANLDPARSEVRFTVTKLGYEDVTGLFRVFTAELRYDRAHPENSSVRWRVAIASVETDARNRDRTLQGPDYFDAARYPEMTFESRAIRRTGDDRLEVSGDITIRGVTRPLIVPVHVTEQHGRRTFVTDFTVDRYDYDVRGGSVMGRLIGRTVRVHLVAVEGETE